MNMFFLATVPSDSEGDNTAAVSPAIVLGTLLILSVTVFMRIIVTCLLRNHRGNDTCIKLYVVFCIVLTILYPIILYRKLSIIIFYLMHLI